MLLPMQQFAPVFEDFLAKRVALVRMWGNVGDGLIDQATCQLLDRFGIDYAVANPLRHDQFDLGAAEIVAIAGGGNLGSRWRGCHVLRRRVLEAAEGRPVIVLPQTYTNAQEHTGYHKVWVRERASLEVNPRASLAPDLALGYEIRFPVPSPSEEEGVWLRADHTLADRWLNQNNQGDPAERTFLGPGYDAIAVERYVRLAAHYRRIWTNRLHFAIAGLLCGRQVTLLPDGSVKNQAVYQTWLRDLGCRWHDAA